MAKKSRATKTEAKTEAPTPATKPTTPTPVATTSEPATPAAPPPAPKATDTTPVPTQESKENRNNIKTAKSTVASPVKMVHQLVAEMRRDNPQVTRKELMAACEAKGVAYYTARTQVQRALKAMKTTTT